MVNHCLLGDLCTYMWNHWMNDFGGFWGIGSLLDLCSIWKHWIDCWLLCLENSNWPIACTMPFHQELPYFKNNEQQCSWLAADRTPPAFVPFLFSPLLFVTCPCCFDGVGWGINALFRVRGTRSFLTRSWCYPLHFSLGWGGGGGVGY